MPESLGIIEEIHSSLKASLHKGRPQQDIDQNVVAFSERVCVEKIAFVPAASPYTMQLNQLRTKYISLNPGAGGPSGATSAHPSSSSASSSNGPATSPGGSSGNALPHPKVTLYPEERLKMDWQYQSRIGAGLVNMGNTCFFNSTLQCLTYTAPLVNYCLSNEHKQKCTKNGFCMMCEIQDHIRTSLNCGGKAIKPHSMLQKLRCIAKHMRWGRQEDAHEFLRFVVDHLQQSCLHGFSKLDARSKETTVINQIFGGYLQSQVTCLRCQAKSNTFDPFMDISLDIKGVDSVEQALYKYVKPETLDQDNAYKCPKCKHKVRAQKRFSIHKAPNILTLQLNRFDLNRHFSGKINRYIRYTEKINIRNFMSQKQGDPILYHLYGVLVHSGYSSDCGHYYSFVKSPSKIWYCMNDSSVHQAGNNSVFSADAYVLFYARINRGTNGSSSKSPATASANRTPNGIVTANKGPFIGPMKPTPPQLPNGLHGTPCSEQGTPIKRQHPNLLPRSIQQQQARPADSTRPGGGTSNNAAPSQPPQATSASALPGAHGHISFPLLSQQQKRLQQIEKQKEDGKHVVLQIKHGNSTTMEKSTAGSSNSVDKQGSNSQGAVSGPKTKLHGLVPYNDDDEDDSDNEKNTKHSKGPSGGSSSTSKTDQPKSVEPLNGGGGDAHNKQYLSHKDKNHNSSNPSAVSNSKPGANSSSPGPNPPSSHSLPHNKPHHTEKSPLTNGQHSTPRQGKAGSLVPLELPVVTVSTSHSSIVKTPSGTWLVQPQDAGVPSPRGSCSSANSVNSTTEWTLQSIGKEKKDRSSYFTSKGDDSLKVKLIEKFSPQIKKTVMSSFDKPKENTLCNGKIKQAEVAAQHPHISMQSSSVSPTKSVHSQQLPLTSMARPDTPVDISDRQPLLSSPPSSQTSESSRKSSKKHKKHKHRETERKLKDAETNGWDDHSRSSSREKKKRNKHKKEERRRRRSRSSSDSESEREVIKRKKSKKRRQESSDDSADSSDRDSKRRRQKRRDTDESDSYEWVEVTKDSSSKHKSSSRASVQSWNHHVKDDVAPKNKSGASKIRSTWDGSRQSKVSSSLHGSSYSFGSNVLSWDGGKNQVDKELHSDRTAMKRHWSDDYNQEIDAGKVKKVKQKLNDDFQRNNPFQQLQSDRTIDKMDSSWPQDHSYSQHKSWHHNGNKKYRQTSH